MLVCLLVCQAAFSVGCGDGRLQTYPVTGKVVFEDGQPVPMGTVEILSSDHAINARGQIASDGSFELGTYGVSDGAVAGTHKAIVIQLMRAESIPAEILREHQHHRGQLVDPKYASYDTSELEVSVSANEKNEIRLVVSAMEEAAE